MVDKDNRKAKRYEMLVSAEIATEHDILQSSTRNLSETGACLTTSAAIEEGSSIDVSLFLTVDGIEDAHSPSADLKARVIWSAPSSEKEFHAGCEFLDTSESQKKALMAFLSAVEKG